MSRRWLPRLLALVLIATGAYYAALAATPYVLMEIAIRRVSERSPMNAFTHAPPVRADVRTIVRPSPDLLYSSCPFDLTNGPVLVDAWPIDDHYSSISVFDARTDAVFVRNDEQMSGRSMRVALAMDGQRTPPGTEVVRLHYRRGIVLQRVLLADPLDPTELASIDPQRRRTMCSPLPGAAP